MMRRASFKIQKVLDEISERQALQMVRERGVSLQGQRRLQRQKSGCENPFFPVQHERVGAEVSKIDIANDALEQPEDVKACSDVRVSFTSVTSGLEDKISRKTGVARKHSVIMEEVEEMVGGRRDCEEEMMQPIKHLSGNQQLYKLPLCKISPDKPLLE